METNSVHLHRVIKTSPEKLFKAFSNPLAQCQWLPPFGYLCEVHSFNFTTGGIYKMSFTNFSTGHSHSFGGQFVEIIPNKYIKYTDYFDDPNLSGEMITSITINAVSCGTELKISQAGIPAIIPAEMCYLGWQESLTKLIQLVEPDIQDA